MLAPRFILVLISFMALGACVEGAPSAGALSDAGRDAQTVDSGADVGSPVDAGGLGDAAVHPDADSQDADTPDAEQVDVGPFEPSRDAVRTGPGQAIAYFPFRDTESLVDESNQGASVALPQGAALDGKMLSLPAGTTFGMSNPLGLYESVRISDAFALEAWVAPRTPGVNGTFITWSQLRLAQKVDPEDGLLGLCISACGTPDARQVGGALRAGQMNHVVVTGAGDVVRLYVGGALVAAWTGAGVKTEFFVNQGGPVVGAAGAAFDFGLVAAYDRELSPGEVLQNALVGPFPSTDNESAMVDEAAIAVVSDGRLSQLEERTRMIAKDVPGSEVGLRSSDSQHALYFLEHNLPAEPELLRTVLLLQTMEAEAGSDGAWRLWRLRVPWTVELTWTETGNGALWEAAGAMGAGDRGTEWIAQRQAVEGQSFGLFRNLSELSWLWQQGAAQNHGFMMTCEGCAIDVARSADRDRAVRPKILSLLLAERSGDAPRPPSGAAYDLQGSSLVLEWDPTPDSVVVEVFVDGRLVRRSHKNFAVVDGVSIPVGNVAAMAVDQWGRRSEQVAVGPR